jgi:hypothetical protein
MIAVLFLANPPRQVSKWSRPCNEIHALLQGVALQDDCKGLAKLNCNMCNVEYLPGIFQICSTVIKVMKVCMFQIRDGSRNLTLGVQHKT